MKNSRLLALVGEQRAGKGTVADIYRKIANYSYDSSKISRHTFSDPVREILKERGIPVGRISAQDLVMELRREQGNDALSKIMEKRLIADPSRRIILDGVRLWPDCEMINRFSYRCLVYVTAPVGLRFERARTDADKSDERNISFKEFCERETHFLEQEIPIIGKLAARYHIVNDGTISELEDKVKALAKKIRF